MSAACYSDDELEALRPLGVYCAPGAQVSRRAAFYGVENITVGHGSRIDDGCILTGRISVGVRVHLAPYCVLYGKAGITIGDYSGFGVGTCMHSESDDYVGGSMFGPCVPAEYQPGKQRAPIVIGCHVLGGTRVTMLPGALIGTGAAIGAHSLVKGSLDPWEVYAGAPARKIGVRDRRGCILVEPVTHWREC